MVLGGCVKKTQKVRPLILFQDEADELEGKSLFLAILAIVALTCFTITSNPTVRLCGIGVSIIIICLSLCAIYKIRTTKFIERPVKRTNVISAIGVAYDPRSNRGSARTR